MYTLELTARDWRDIQIVGDRYAWSAALLEHYDTDEAGEPLVIVLAEHEAWELNEAIEDDDAWCPMLDRYSDLAEKLISFQCEII